MWPNFLMMLAIIFKAACFGFGLLSIHSLIHTLSSNKPLKWPFIVITIILYIISLLVDELRRNVDKMKDIKERNRRSIERAEMYNKQKKS